MTPTGTGQSISPRSAKRRRRAKGGVATAMAVAILAVIVGVALLAPVLAPYDPYEVDLSAALQPPGSAHLLGTDMQGRDLLSRIMYGTRLTLLTSLTALVSGSVVGALLGLAAVFFPSSDAVIGRLLDILLSVPAIRFGLALGASLGPGLLPVTIALSIATVPEVGRIARAAGLTIARQEYMQSGRAIGLGNDALLQISGLELHAHDLRLPDAAIRLHHFAGRGSELSRARGSAPGGRAWGSGR